MMKITVITVCYNSVKTIEKTIRSVIAQNYDDLEYIIIDGGSVDGTLDIIEKYKDKISLYISEPDNGIYDAMNKGLERATGDIFAFLNGDDYYSDNVLKGVNQYFETSNADLVSGNIYLCANGISRKAIFDKSNREKMFFETIYPHPALFAKKELYIKYGGFDMSYQIAADIDWVMKVCLNGANVLCVEDYFTYFSDGGVSFRKRYKALEEQYQVALKYACLEEYSHLTKAINDFYSVKLKQTERWERKRNALDKKTEEVKKLFNYNKRYYIWGIGNRGMECMDLFEKLGLRIGGFIDSYQSTAEVNGYRVIRPEDIDVNNSICITPKGYEEEIICKLKNMGLGEMEYFTYADILEQIISLGEVER